MLFFMNEIEKQRQSGEKTNWKKVLLSIGKGVFKGGILSLGIGNEIAGKLSGLRGKIAHGNFCGAFSDVDAQKIHFLEILVYAQTLKRAKIEDEHIERILGAVFGCNYILSEEWSNDI